MNTKSFVVFSIVAGCMLGIAALAEAQTTRRSGLYMTSGDYENQRLSFEGVCGSTDHNLELHNVLHKSYIHVKHESEMRRFAKKELFGFRACDGRDYRFVSNLEYQIMEAKQLYIYVHEKLAMQGRTTRTFREYYFSVGGNGQIHALTLPNLKEAFPEDHRFQALLDSSFGNGQDLAEYDKSRETFAVNRILLASHEQ